jgi:hypothetical protein
MKLHGNAALSWSGRRRLAERVIVEGWTLKEAAVASGVSVRCARMWLLATEPRVWSGFRIVPRRRGELRIGLRSSGWS